jgi:glycosyltransferase involved in cell wall biosynthesis
MNKMISIVIPTYNCAGLLSEMVNAIVSQTYKDWELIVVDDGSTDNTATIMDSYVTDERVIYVTRPTTIRKGAQGCRNYGFSLAKGEYVCFFDSDDLISRTCLEERISFIEKERCDYAIFPAATFQDDVKEYKLSKMGVPTGEDILTSFLSHYAQFTVWTAIYRKNAIENIQWDEKIKVYQDF